MLWNNGIYWKNISIKLKVFSEYIFSVFSQWGA